MRFLRLVGSILSGFSGKDGFSRNFAGAFPGRRRSSGLAFRLSALAVLALVLSLAWLVLASFYSSVVEAGYRLPRRPEVVFFTAALLGWLVLFLAALPAARSLFLDRGENELFLSLPIPPLQVSAARFIVLWLYLLPVELFVLSPALAAYLQRAAFDSGVLFGCAVSLFIVPLAPAALALALALGLRRAPRNPRLAVPVEIAAATLLLAAFAVLQSALQRSLSGARRLEGLVADETAAIALGRLMDAVPPAAWFADVFRAGSALPGLACLVSGGAFAAAAVWLATRAFPSGSGFPGRPRGARKDAATARVIPRTMSVALLRREAALFFARPGLAAEAALRLFALPVFLILSAAAQPRETAEALSGIFALSPFAAPAAIGLLLFVVDASFLAAGAVSREGRLLGLSLSLPLSGARQVKAKFVFLLLISLPPAGLALALVHVLFPVPAETLVCSVPGVAAYFVFSIAVGLFLDLRRTSAGRPDPLTGRAGSPRPSSTAVLASAADAAALCLLGLAAAGLLAAGVSPLASGFFVVTVLAAADLVIVPRLFREADRRYAGGIEA